MKLPIARHDETPRQSFPSKNRLSLCGNSAVRRTRRDNPFVLRNAGLACSITHPTDITGLIRNFHHKSLVFSRIALRTRKIAYGLASRVLGVNKQDLIRITVVEYRK